MLCIFGKTDRLFESNGDHKKGSFSAKKVVYLASGHGGADPGAVANGMREKDSNLVVMLKCKSEMERHGVKVICNRTKDVEVSLADKVAQANKSDAEIALSFHSNAGGGDGFEVYYYSTSANGKKLAALCEKYVKQMGQNSRGLKSGNHLYFIKQTAMPAVLVESYFLDNKTDVKIGDTRAEQERFGVAYAKAVLEYLDIAYKPKEETKPAAPTKTPEKTPMITVLEWQKAAIKDGFRFPKFEADGEWGNECASVARQAVVRKRTTYMYKNLTTLVQKVVGVKQDGLCGPDTDKAIIAYQKKHGLTADGAVGIKSWKKMLGV